MVEGFFKTQTQSKTKVKLNWKKGGGAAGFKSQKTPVLKEQKSSKK